MSVASDLFAVPRPLRILLVGNFAPDEQESMLRFEQMMAVGLRARGHVVETISPVPILARLARPYRYAGWPKLLGYADKFLLFPLALRRHVRGFAPDVVHIVDHANAGYARNTATKPCLVTCHDLLQIRVARGEFPVPRPSLSGRWFQARIRHHLSRLAHVACVSEQTRVDLRRIAGLKTEQIDVVHNGLNQPFRRVPVAEARSVLAPLLARTGLSAGVLGCFLFNIGGTQWYKNRSGLLSIYAELRRLLPSPPALLLAGKALSPELLAQCEALGIQSHVIPLGTVTAAELESLYSLAEGLLFPSWAEGFGWPIAEAQTCGCPVFTSNRAPLTEVGGDAAVYFDPADPLDAARQISAHWSRRTELRSAGLQRAELWSPQRMLAAYENLYRRMHAIPRAQ